MATHLAWPVARVNRDPPAHLQCWNCGSQGYSIACRSARREPGSVAVRAIGGDWLNFESDFLDEHELYGVAVSTSNEQDQSFV